MRLQRLVGACEAICALMMAAMFATFILQVTIRYTARLSWIGESVPLLDPTRYGWTLEFCLALWVWIVFFGCATIVRQRDHVSFDILYLAVPTRVQRIFAVIACIIIGGCLLWSVLPTWDKFYILRIKQTATLKQLVGDWVRMRDVYSIYIFFLVIVSLRCAWRVWHVFRHGADPDQHHHEELTNAAGSAQMADESTADQTKAGDR